MNLAALLGCSLESPRWKEFLNEIGESPETERFTKSLEYFKFYKSGIQMTYCHMSSRVESFWIYASSTQNYQKFSGNFFEDLSIEDNKESIETKIKAIPSVVSDNLSVLKTPLLPGRTFDVHSYKFEDFQLNVYYRQSNEQPIALVGMSCFSNS